MHQLTPRPHIIDKICQGAVVVRSIHLFSLIPPWCWNLSQLPQGKKRGTPWTETQTAIHTHIHMVDLESSVSLALLSACLWSAGGSWREPTQAPHRKALAAQWIQVQVPWSFPGGLIYSNYRLYISSSQVFPIKCT